MDAFLLKQKRSTEPNWSRLDDLTGCSEKMGVLLTVPNLDITETRAAAVV